MEQDNSDDWNWVGTAWQGYKAEIAGLKSPLITIACVSLAALILCKIGG